eukprot:Nk52_evm51s78 gene=Nk52_evmTU51s78
MVADCLDNLQLKLDLKRKAAALWKGEGGNGEEHLRGILREAFEALNKYRFLCTEGRGSLITSVTEHEKVHSGIDVGIQGSFREETSQGAIEVFEGYYDCVLKVATLLIGETDANIKRKYWGCISWELDNQRSKFANRLLLNTGFILDLLRCIVHSLNVTEQEPLSDSRSSLNALELDSVKSLVSKHIFHIRSNPNPFDDEVQFALNGSYICYFFEYGVSAFVIEGFHEASREQKSNECLVNRELEMLTWLFAQPLLEVASGKPVDNSCCVQRKSAIVTDENENSGLKIVDRLSSLISLCISMRCTGFLKIASCLMTSISTVRKDIAYFIFNWILDDHFAPAVNVKPFFELSSSSPLFANRIVWFTLTTLTSNISVETLDEVVANVNVYRHLLYIVAEWCANNPRLLITAYLAPYSNPFLMENTGESSQSENKLLLFCALEIVVYFPLVKNLVGRNLICGELEDVVSSLRTAIFKAIVSRCELRSQNSLLSIDFGQKLPVSYILPDGNNTSGKEGDCTIDVDYGHLSKICEKIETFSAKGCPVDSCKEAYSVIGQFFDLSKCLFVNFSEENREQFSLLISEKIRG